MSSIYWKSILLKHKDVCNQIVRSVKRTNVQFPEEDLAHHLKLFFGSILKNLENEMDDETIVTLFETLVTLISKHVLPIQNQSALEFYQIISEIHPDVKKDPVLFFSYFANVFSKLETDKKDLFLKRFHSVLPKIQTMEEVKLVLGLLFWASGKPEYRESLLSLFQNLNQTLKTEIKNLFGIDETSIQSPFLVPKENQSEKPNFHFRSIPGYTMFGGNFQKIPILYFDSERLLVSSGETWFQLFVDEFGTSLYSIEKPMSVTKVSDKPSNFWKQMIQQKLDPNFVTSSIEKDSYAIITLSNSYQLYLFYKGRT
ncbi:hypothetical protein EHQ46_11475 [Leptospira yanagawae]|uniref:Uncharacterized protein n=1 Tax=Leptospira yanagawae TaxID=293069 RepID=A0ABY2M3A1_9LEPT|nr:hypothetical protein [Leptospira yanagawae]TGL20005.1 hypothetical protein EHQ46_11475 [Leptospira yanagawae]